MSNVLHVCHSPAGGTVDATVSRLDLSWDAPHQHGEAADTDLMSARKNRALHAKVLMADGADRVQALCAICPISSMRNKARSRRSSSTTSTSRWRHSSTARARSR
mmetsp:Transcript_15886/g.43199  ORF Transcript_15886/g.43199 Transcript_15886/m.43199 type:complete len:105 (-) Transcript_15886:1446-1760(-)